MIQLFLSLSYDEEIDMSILNQWCKVVGIKIYGLSTDIVFDFILERCYYFLLQIDRYKLVNWFLIDDFKVLQSSKEKLKKFVNKISLTGWNFIMISLVKNLTLHANFHMNLKSKDWKRIDRYLVYCFFSYSFILQNKGSLWVCSQHFFKGF